LKSLINTKEVFSEDETLLDNQDFAFLLKVSKRTLQQYRSNGQLPYFMIAHKTYYRTSDVREFVRFYMDFQTYQDFEKKHLKSKDEDKKVDLEITTSKDTLVNVLKKLDEHFGKIAVVINKQSASLDKLSTIIDNHSKKVNNQTQIQQRDNQKLLKLISLYSELATCGVLMPSFTQSMSAASSNGEHRAGTSRSDEMLYPRNRYT
jgi:hypothetical protein